MNEIDLPEDADSVSVVMREDDVYVCVDVLSNSELIESHEYAIGPEADR